LEEEGTSMTDLSADQRWLLYAMGGWAIRDCLISPAGTDHLMQSMWGSVGRTHPEGGPQWLTGWDTHGGKITAPSASNRRVTITKAQINAYARTLPADVRDELLVLRSEDQAEHQRTNGWCHCPWANTPPNAHSGPCTRYHPTADEDNDHWDALNRIENRLDNLLRHALNIGATTARQLALFDAP